MRLVNCPYCLGNKDNEDNILIFCKYCKGTGKVSIAIRDYWRAHSVPLASTLPVNFKKKSNDDDVYF